jgi:hypothetical protein
MKNIILSIVAMAGFLLTKGQQTYITGGLFVGASEELVVFDNLTLASTADVKMQDNATLRMIGANTVVASGANITNTNNTQIGTGRFLFAGTAGQTLNGGNSSALGGAHPSFLNVAIDNVHNLSLTGSNTRITNGLNFINGHLVLANLNLELASTAATTNANGTRHVVTNGTGFLAKESFSSAFTFPIGRATSDYTPATITPTVADDFFVQVKNYSESASDEVTSADGINRTWNIYSTNGTGARLALQHNNSSNGANYTANGGDAMAFVTQYLGIDWVPYVGSQGTWQKGTGAQGTNVQGSISGSVIHSRDYTVTATSSSANAAFFSKSTLELTPLPVSLLQFDAQKENQSSALLSWVTSTEINSAFFEVQTSHNGHDWHKLGEVRAQGNSYETNAYKFLHQNPLIGINYYRLNAVDLDGHSQHSQVRFLEFPDRHFFISNIVVFPNPVENLLNVRSENKITHSILYSIDGKLVADSKNDAEGTDFTLDLSSFANGVYYLKLISIIGQEKVFKITVNK